MKSFQKMSDKAAIVWSLLVFYAPYAWVLFAAEFRWGWVKMWPLLPGMMTALLLHAGTRRIHFLSGDWPLIPVAVVFSIVLFAATLFFVLRFPRQRLITLGVVLAASVGLSYVAYMVYRA